MESSIWCASGPELSILATTIAIYISEIYAIEDLNTIACFFNILGDTLTLIANQKIRCEVSIASLNTSKSNNN